MAEPIYQRASDELVKQYALSIGFRLPKKTESMSLYRLRVADALSRCTDYPEESLRQALECLPEELPKSEFSTICERIAAYMSEEKQDTETLEGEKMTFIDWVDFFARDIEKPNDPLLELIDKFYEPEEE